MVHDGERTHFYCDDLPAAYACTSSSNNTPRSNLAMTGEDQTISASVKVIWQLVNP